MPRGCGCQQPLSPLGFSAPGGGGGVNLVHTAIRYVSDTDGSNSNDGSFDRPLKTVQKAVDLLEAGVGSGLVGLFPGTYDELVVVTNSGFAFVGLSADRDAAVIRNATGPVVDVAGAEVWLENLTLKSVSSDKCLRVAAGTRTVLRNVKIMPDVGATDFDPMSITLGTDHVLDIDGCEFVSAGAGRESTVTGGTNATIRICDTLFDGNSWSGAGGGLEVIAGTTLKEVTLDGVHCEAGATGTSVCLDIDATTAPSPVAVTLRDIIAIQRASGRGAIELHSTMLVQCGDWYVSHPGSNTPMTFSACQGAIDGIVVEATSGSYLAKIATASDLTISDVVAIFSGTSSAGQCVLVRDATTVTLRDWTVDWQGDAHIWGVARAEPTALGSPEVVIDGGTWRSPDTTPVFYAKKMSTFPFQGKITVTRGTRVKTVGGPWADIDGVDGTGATLDDWGPQIESGTSDAAIGTNVTHNKLGLATATHHGLMPATAPEYRVGDQYATIQAAIDAAEATTPSATNRVVVHVPAGEHTEDPTIKSSYLTLRGDTGQGVTVIKGTLTYTNATDASITTYETSDDPADLVNEVGTGPWNNHLQDIEIESTDARPALRILGAGAGTSFLGNELLLKNVTIRKGTGSLAVDAVMANYLATGGYTWIFGDWRMRNCAGFWPLFAEFANDLIVEYDAAAVYGEPSDTANYGLAGQQCRFFGKVQTIGTGRIGGDLAHGHFFSGGLDLDGGASVIHGGFIDTSLDIAAGASLTNYGARRVIAVTGAGTITEYQLVRKSIRTDTATTTATDADDVILMDASGGPRTVNLPTAASAKGKAYDIKKIDSSANAVTVDPSGAETIDGGATAALTTQYESITITSDGSTWWVL